MDLEFFSFSRRPGGVIKNSARDEYRHNRFDVIRQESLVTR